MTVFTGGTGKYKVCLEVIRHDEGLTAVLTGGEKTHVGAVVLALPRQSLTGEGSSCDCYVLPVPGHKDDVVAKTAAETLCLALNEPVCVSAGIHLDNASREDIELLTEACRQAILKAEDFYSAV